MINVMGHTTLMQVEYKNFVEQSDKSKFELQQSIEKVDNLIKSLIMQKNI